MMCSQQPFCEVLYQFPLRQASTPCLRDALLTIEGTGELAVDCTGGVGVVTEVDG